MMMEKILMQPKQVRFGKVVKFILPTYLTSLFNTLYTIVDGKILLDGGKVAEHD